MGLKQFLAEHYVNATTDTTKRKYAQEVWDMLQSSYAYIGGIKGEEFKTAESMLAVPFWKLVVRNGKVVACILYKDNNGRKSIASGTDGSKEAKHELVAMLKQEFTRGYKEVSGAAEGFIKKHFPALYDKFKIPADQVSKIIGKEVEPQPDGYHYKRKISGEDHVKIMLGTPGKKLVLD